MLAKREPFEASAVPIGCADVFGEGEGMRTLTAQDIFLALIAELDHPQGYITKDPMTLDSVTVDGVISCEAIAEFLNFAAQGDSGVLRRDVAQMRKALERIAALPLGSHEQKYIANIALAAQELREEAALCAHDVPRRRTDG